KKILNLTQNETKNNTKQQTIVLIMKLNCIANFTLKLFFHKYRKGEAIEYKVNYQPILLILSI
ncbi:TPA: hypothetical protein ACMDUP_004058, partial [Vibrio parahaemolyticus]